MLKACLFEVGFIRLCSYLFAMDDEGPLDLIDREGAREVINHLLVIAMSGEAFNLRDLGFDLSVETEDRDPLESGLLNTCAKCGRFAITDNKNRAARIRNVVRNVVFDAPCLQHA